MHTAILLRGECDILVDEASCNLAANFLNVPCIEFAQHVRFLTHTKGHTWDIVCSLGT